MCNVFNKNYTNLKNLNINFGPQHPAAHGVLRLILSLDGEIVRDVDAHVGLLHRGTEKLIEYKNALQALPYFDRLDYVSMMAQELCYSLCVESLLNIEVPVRAFIIRILFLELTRILNHLLAITTHALDVGALTPFLWAFEEREKLMEFYERVSGARLHANYIRPGGVSTELPLGFCNDLIWFIKKSQKTFDCISDLLSQNRVWKERLCYVGNIDKLYAIDFSFSGVLMRSCGVPWDLRLLEFNEKNPKFNLKIPVSFNGDCYDRYLIRLEEMYQSLSILNQSLHFLNSSSGLSKIDYYKIQIPDRVSMKSQMEALIHHFKLCTRGFNIKEDNNYVCIEAPKGEFGVSLFGANNSRPLRCKIRSPGFFHLQGLNSMSRNCFLADVVTIIGTLDLVFGEIDR